MVYLIFIIICKLNLFEASIFLTFILVDYECHPMNHTQLALLLLSIHAYAF